MTKPVAPVAQTLHPSVAPPVQPRDAAADAVGQSCGTAVTVHVHRHKGLQGQRGAGASALTVAGILCVEKKEKNSALVHYINIIYIYTYIYISLIL
jgi:hypothetical protein